MILQKMFQTISTGGIQVRKTSWIIAITSVCVICACKQQGAGVYNVSSASDAKAFVEAESKKNSYETKIKEVNFILKHISNEQMALRDLGDISHASQATFDSILKGYDSLLFFNLEISIDNFTEEMIHYKLNASEEAAFDKRTAYYAFDMQKDISIVLADKDTIPCAMYHYERNYGVSPKNNFMLGFNVSQLKNAVLVYDNKYLTTGPVKFALNEQELFTHPQIKIN